MTHLWHWRHEQRQSGPVRGDALRSITSLIVPRTEPIRWMRRNTDSEDARGEERHFENSSLVQRLADTKELTGGVVKRSSYRRVDEYALPQLGQWRAVLRRRSPAGPGRHLGSRPPTPSAASRKVRVREPRRCSRFALARRPRAARRRARPVPPPPRGWLPPRGRPSGRTRWRRSRQVPRRGPQAGVAKDPASSSRAPTRVRVICH